MSEKTEIICKIEILSALYVVLSAFLKITIIGNIQVDLGYIAFAVALCELGIHGTYVGAIGCAVESILFSAYGFSISWLVANITIGIIYGLIVRKKDKTLYKIMAAAFGCIIGLLILKTVIECALYSIPIAVKIPKNAVAMCMDFAAMTFGIIIYQFILPKMRHKNV